MKKIALVKSKNGIWEAFYNVLNRKDYNITLIDPFFNDDLENLLNNKWDALVWFAKHNPKIKNLAKKILNTFDLEQNIKIFPDWNSYWHYDDKVSQYFFLKRNGIPIPPTQVFFNKNEALKYILSKEFPLIFKFSEGASSSNVKIIKNERQAKKEVKNAFDGNLKNIFSKRPLKKHLIIQEYQRNNSGDYRLVCYGNEILGYFRVNRDEEPLASGSKKFEFKDIPLEIIQMVYNISKKFNYEVMSYDILKGNNSEWLITELSAVYGDIRYKVYDQAKIYQLQQDMSWKEIKTSQPHYERIADYISRQWFENA